MMADIETNMIKGLKEGNPKAQQMMVERYGRHVFNQVVRLLPSVEDAEEVYQDVFLKVFLNINRYEEEKSFMVIILHSMYFMISNYTIKSPVNQVF